MDIFFVISGYLITSLIKKEISIKNGISYLNFLDKRIRRIIPLIIFIFFIKHYNGNNDPNNIYKHGRVGLMEVGVHYKKNTTNNIG